MMLFTDRDNVKPSVLLVEQGDVLGTLHDLHRVGRIHGTHQAKGQATSCVIAIGGVIDFSKLSCRLR